MTQTTIQRQQNAFLTTFFYVEENKFKIFILYFIFILFLFYFFCSAQEQQFGTFGRPGTMIANHHRQTLTPQYESRMTTAANQSEESLQPIFQSSHTFPTKKQKHSSNQVRP